MHDTPPHAPAIPALIALVIALALAGCGYRQDLPGLPGGAERLALGPIRNLTYEPELDIRLRERLQARLLRHARIRLVDEARAELVLTADIASLAIDRRIETAEPQRKVLTFTVAGRLTLQDRRDDRLLLENQPVQASEQLAVDVNALETPAIRDEGLDKALSALAAGIERQLLLHF